MTGTIRLAIVSGLLHHTQGGPATVIHRQFRSLRSVLEVTVLGVASPQQQEEVRQLLPGSQLFAPAWPKRWFRGAGLTAALWRTLPDCDVVHAHMLWDHPVWAAWRVARALRKPLIITPHGSLMEPWRYQSWHKRLYRLLLLERMLRSTAFLHVLSQQEAEACRRAAVPTPIRVVPNGLEAEAFQHPGSAEAAVLRWPRLAGKRILLYLGRLWEEKGVGDLQTAWANLCHSECAADWHLVLAGPDYRGYQQHLLRQQALLGIQERVSLPGVVTGRALADLFALASGFVLPSHSEGLSSALLEAMAVGLPAVYTQGCHFPLLAHHAGGIEVPCGTLGLQAGLCRLLQMDDSGRRHMGHQAKQLAQRDFTMERVSAALCALYREALQPPVAAP
ncbi:MAG: glycosyltransferase [Magnetococcales bacterium]|nr:glycosyltransferase [Magnetococcales bacterium]